MALQRDRAEETTSPDIRSHPRKGASTRESPGLRGIGLLGLQRSAGNAATTLFVQRHLGPTQMPVSAVIGTGGSAPDAATRKTNVEGILEDSEEGRTAKTIADEPAPGKSKVNINWEGALNGGSYFVAPSDVTFDVGMSDESTALAYVHEMNHARASALGVSADVASLSKEDYISKTFKEETEGTVLAILAARHTNEAVAAEAEAKKVSMPQMSAGFAFDTEYWKAHDDAVAALPKETSEEEKEKKGREAGTAKILTGFTDGTIKTSMPGNPSYVKWYGDIWDGAHPPPPTAPGGASGTTKS